MSTFMDKNRNFVKNTPKGIDNRPKPRNIKTIEAEMVSICNMQIKLAEAISDLTAASAIHQVASKIVEAFLYVGAFVEMSAKYTVMKSAEAVGILGKSGLRATVIKNSADFFAITARRGVVKNSVREAIKDGSTAIGYKTMRSIGNKLTNDPTLSYEVKEQVGLYIDALTSSGQGTLEQLIKMNDHFDKEYDELAKEHERLLHS